MARKIINSNIHKINSQNYKGMLYEPNVVNACINLFNRKGFQFPERYAI